MQIEIKEKLGVAILISHEIDFRKLGEDGSKIGGSGVHFPSTPVKYLANLRSTANSQWYTSI